MLIPITIIIATLVAAEWNKHLALQEDINSYGTHLRTAKREYWSTIACGCLIMGFYIVGRAGV